VLYIDLAPFIYAWFIGKDINAEIVTQTLIFNIPDKEEIKHSYSESNIHEFTETSG
jgi:hypothetical protein